MRVIQIFCEKEGEREGGGDPRGSKEASQVRTGKKHEYIFHLEVFLKVFRPKTQ